MPRQFELTEQMKEKLLRSLVNDARLAVRQAHAMVPEYLTMEEARETANLAIENAQHLIDVYSAGAFVAYDEKELSEMDRIPIVDAYDVREVDILVAQLPVADIERAIREGQASALVRSISRALNARIC